MGGRAGSVLAKLEPFRMILCLSLVLMASFLISITRVSILLVCLWINPYSFYVVCGVCVDVCNGGGDQGVGGDLGVVLGYVLVGLGYYLFNSRTSTDFGVLEACVGFGGGMMVLTMSGAVGASCLTGLGIVAVVGSGILYAIDNLGDDKNGSVFGGNGSVFVYGGLSVWGECMGWIIGKQPHFLVNVCLCLVITSSYGITQSYTILTQLITHKDTKAIFQFLVLNFSFMVVQLVYSFKSGSLGLFSDSLHMALDCSSLALGLVAGILSKSPIDPNSKYPFGYSGFETLAGFTNGTLLVGISGGIIFEAITRLYNPIELRATNELIVVSVLGLAVNLVGIFAFNHGDGHGHGHSHGIGNGHDLGNGHGGHEEHGHEGHSHSHTHSHSHAHNEPHLDGDSCGDWNDNMKGIFLHILADTLGSVGVVISTILTKIFGWEGFDPIASIIIAVLIFLSAIPLIKSTGTSLLLSLPKAKETKIRTTLEEVATIKGVKSFTTPRFWPSQSSVVGYIHVQVYNGENSGQIKKQVKRVFGDIDVMVQMEYDYEECWCRN